MLGKIYKKAQGATEYLIVLAIVIIIALIVVGVMGGIPGIGGGASGRSNAAFLANQDVAFTSYAVSAAGTDTVILKNNQRNTITVNDLVVNGVDLAAGESVAAGGSRTYTGAIAACTAGQAYSYAASVAYTDSATSASYNLTGNGQKLEGNCAT